MLGRGHSSLPLLFRLGVPPPNPNGGVMLTGRPSQGDDALSSWQVQARGAALLCHHGLLPRPGRPFHGKSPHQVGLASGWRGPRVVLEMVRLRLLLRQMVISYNSPALSQFWTKQRTLLILELPVRSAETLRLHDSSIFLYPIYFLHSSKMLLIRVHPNVNRFLRSSVIHT